jgi:hypothetical protein
MSEVLDPPLTHPVAPALQAAERALDDLVALAGAAAGSGDLWTLGSEDLVEAAAAAHRLVARADAVLHAMVREVDVRGAAVSQGSPHTHGWLRARLKLHHGHAKRLLATAGALHDDQAGPLVPTWPDELDPGDGDGAEVPTGRQRLRAAFATGAVAGEQVSVVTAALAALPPVEPAVAEAAAQFLAEQAPMRDPAQLARLGRRLRHRLDPDAGDTLAAAEARAVATRTLDIRVAPDGSSRLAGRLDPELTAELLAQLEPLAAPRPEVDGVKDARPLGRRRADALADLLRLAASAEGRPTRHGTRPTITVTVTLDGLRKQLGEAGALLDWSGPIAAETARRLACDARVVPAVLGSHGQPLDVGRASYTVTAGIWRALVARDRGCAFAGCDRPPEWTEAHHNGLHWADGGDTSVENCCLLCDFHHRQVHHHGWTLVLRDGQMWTIPPPWVDPAQTPHRNTGRDALADLDAFTFDDPDDS